MLDAVSEEVLQQSLQAVAVREHLAVGLEDDVDVARVGLAVAPGSDALDRPELVRVVPVGQLPDGDRLDRSDGVALSGEREHVLDQPLHLVEGVLAAVEVVAAPRLPREPEVAGEHVEGVPEVVRDDRGELVEPLVLAFDPLLVRPPLRDVAAAGEEPVLAVDVDPAHVDLDGERRAVGPRERRLQPDRLVHLDFVPHLDRRLRVHLPVDVPHLHPGELLGIVTQLRRHHSIHVDDLARLVVDVDHVRRAVVEGLEPSGGAFEPAPAAAVVRHVAGDPQDAVELPIDDEAAQPVVDDRLRPPGELDLDRPRQRLAVPLDERRERVAVSGLADPPDQPAPSADELLAGRIVHRCDAVVGELESGVGVVDGHAVGKLVDESPVAFEVALALLLLGHVDVDPHRADRISVRVALDDAAAVPDPHPLARLRPHPVVAPVVLRLPGEVGLERRPRLVDVVRMHPVFPLRELEGDLGAVVAQHLGPPLVEPDLVGAEVPVPDADVGALDREPKPLRELAELALALLAFGHVAEVDGEAGLRGVDVDGEVGVDRLEAAFEGPLFAVRHRRSELLLEKGPADRGEPFPDLVAEQVAGVAFEHLGGPLVEVREPPLRVDLAERVRHAVEVLRKPAVGPRLRHDARDPRHERVVRVVGGVLREVPVGAGGDRLAGYPLGPLPGEQHEREVAASLPDGF